MKLSEVKKALNQVETIGFKLPNGELVPRHFHFTEVGAIHKHFVDCGGTERTENVINFQLWNANDYDHRLHPEKLVYIINVSEKKLKLKDLEVEVEYQGRTIEKFALDFDGTNFLLISRETACLALNDSKSLSKPVDKNFSKSDNTNDSYGGCC